MWTEGEDVEVWDQKAGWIKATFTAEIEDRRLYEVEIGGHAAVVHDCHIRSSEIAKLRSQDNGT